MFFRFLTLQDCKAIDKLNNENRLVVAFGEVNEFALKGISGISVKDLVNWVLDQKSEISHESAKNVFEDFFLTTRVTRNHFVPIFYLFKYNADYKNHEKVLNLKKNLDEWIIKLNNDNRIPLLLSHEEIKSKKVNYAVYKYLGIIAKSYSNGKISYEECLSLLKDYYNDDPSLPSDFRKVITLLDMKKFY